MEIKNILQESIYNYLLLEAKSPEEVYKILCDKFDLYLKPYIIKNIMNIDPTKKFSYTQWACNVISNQTNSYNVDYLKLEELFNFAKENNDFQLQTFKTLDDAYLGMTTFSGRKEYEVAYEDDKWIIYIPQTYAAERYIVHHLYGGANWCTASSEGNSFFKQYNYGGFRLFICANKATQEIYQYSPKSGEFHDSRNVPVASPSNLVGKDVDNWFSSQGMNIDEGTFPGEYDFYEGGDYGLKCINDLYAKYVLVDSQGQEVDNAPVIYNPLSFDDDYENSILIHTQENDVRYWFVYDKETHKCIGDFDDTYGEPYLWDNKFVCGLNSEGAFQFVSLAMGVEYNVPSWEEYNDFTFVYGVVVLSNANGYYELYDTTKQELCSYVDTNTNQSYYVRFNYEPYYDEDEKVFVGEDEEGYEIVYNPSTKELQSEKDGLEGEGENEEAYSMSENVKKQFMNILEKISKNYNPEILID